MTSSINNLYPSLSTRLFRSGHDRKSALGAIVPPIYQTTAFAFDSCEDAQELFSLTRRGHMYGRTSNPTNDVLERRLCDLEGGTDAVTAASGKAALMLAVLDRLVTLAHKNLARPIRIVLFAPAPFGPGVHDPDQPGHLLLNTVTNQVDSFSARHFGEVPLPGALPFFDWMRQSDGNVPTSGFLPRRTFGAYMRFVFNTLKENLPDNADLLALNLAVTDVEPRHDARYRLTDSEGGWHDVDHVFICTDHGQHGVPVTDRRDGALSPYPCDALHSAIAPRSVVGAQGLCSRISLPGLSYLSVDADARPLDSTGLPLEGVSVLGVPSEGSTYFNHDLPSPRSRAHVFEQINRALTALTALTERADSRQCSAA